MKSIIIILIIWMAVACAVCAGLYFTQDIRCLFFILTPLLLRITIQEDE